MWLKHIIRRWDSCLTFHIFLIKKCPPPVVKCSWTSAAGLDRDREGIVVGGWGGGGREVEAGEDWVRTNGWWGQMRAGPRVGSNGRPCLRITCLCGYQGSGWRDEQRISKRLSLTAQAKTNQTKLPHNQKSNAFPKYNAATQLFGQINISWLEQEIGGESSSLTSVLAAYCNFNCYNLV